MKITYVLPFLCIAIGSPLAVKAEDTGFYLGAGGGESNYSDDIGHQIHSAYANYSAYRLDSATLSDDSSGAYKLFEGYRFTPWLAFELTWTDLGEAKSSYELTGLTSQPHIRGRYSLHGASAALDFRLPINDHFFISGRAGAFASRLNYKESSLIHLENSAGTVSNYHFRAETENQTEPLLGVSLGWKWDSRWAMRLDWDRYFRIGTRFDLTADANGRFDHIDQYSIDLIYSFED